MSRSRSKPASLFTYTSTSRSVDRGRVSDVIIAPVIGVTYAPKLQKTLYGEFTVRQQFSTTRISAALILPARRARRSRLLRFRRPQLNLRANLDYNRLTGTG